MPWFKVDDNLAFHHKVIAAGNAAIGLWARAGAASAQQLTDGFIPEHLARSLGTYAQARKLVEVGLWITVPGGYQFHEWDQRQPMKCEVEAERAAARERMRAKRSVNVRANIERTSPDRSDEVREPRPVPSRPLSVVTSSSQSSNATRGLDEDGLTRIEQATKGPRTHALKVADHVLTRSNGDVRDPLRYVLKAIEAEPENFRYRRGNPTKATACPEHPGEWADNCRIHRSETGA